MLSTAKWNQVTKDVMSELSLDPRNVRLETTDLRVEADIIGDLFDNEDVLDLVERICKVGYLTHERPVVVVRDDAHVVVEGNRRLAALKTIQNPNIVPRYRAKVETFTRLLTNREALAKIEVMVAPSQEEADQFIAAVHTGRTRRTWSPLRQAAFFQSQIDAGRTLAQLVERYPTIDVRQFVKSATVLQRFASTPFADDQLNIFIRSHEWKKAFSTLMRIIESSQFLELTGLQMDEHGDLKMSITDSQFDDIATHIISEVQERNYNTRTLNKAEPVNENTARNVNKLRKCSCQHFTVLTG